MNEFNLTIGDQLFTLNESNYKSQFDEIVNNLTRFGWLTGEGMHEHLMERGHTFLNCLRETIFKECRNSQDYSLHTTIIEKLHRVAKIIDPETNKYKDNTQEFHINSTYTKVERFSLAVELYENEFRKLLPIESMGKGFLEIIYYIREIEYCDSNKIGTHNLPKYINWIKNNNQKIKNAHDIKEKIRLLELSQKKIELSQKKIEEITSTEKLVSAWNTKRKHHAIIFLLIFCFMAYLLCAGCKTLNEWMISSSIDFNNFQEKMGIVEFIYGAIFHWHLQYKLILILIWAAIIGQSLQIAKSQWHLFNDASERIAIIRTYRIFSENVFMGEPGKYMEAMLQSVFRTADDGILKDVKTILPSGLYGLQTKTKEE